MVFTSADVPGPISNRQPNMIQTGSSDGREIRFSDPLPSRNTKTAARKNRGREEKRNNHVSKRVIANSKQARRNSQCPSAFEALPGRRNAAGVDRKSIRRRCRRCRCCRKGWVLSKAKRKSERHENLASDGMDRMMAWPKVGGRAGVGHRWNTKRVLLERRAKSEK